MSAPIKPMRAHLAKGLHCEFTLTAHTSGAHVRARDTADPTDPNNHTED